MIRELAFDDDGRLIGVKGISRAREFRKSTTQAEFLEWEEFVARLER